jgi:hypothetical protein
MCSAPMPDRNGDVLKAIEELERAAEVLEEAIEAHADAATKAKLQKHVPKLRDVIESLNDDCDA